MQKTIICFNKKSEVIEHMELYENNGIYENNEINDNNEINETRLRFHDPTPSRSHAFTISRPHDPMPSQPHLKNFVKLNLVLINSKFKFSYSYKFTS